MRRQDDTRAAVNTGKFLYRNRVTHDVKPGTAILGRIRKSHPPALTQFTDRLLREFIVLIHQESLRSDFFLRELADLRPQCFLSSGCLK